eukprot:m.187408 g.187408  ORF g.187408 m.187408 type:complete len:337 (+) comp17066_c0_seq1:103-1113(+)
MDVDLPPEHAMALQRFLMENSVEDVSPEDAVYKYDAAGELASRSAAPWEKDPHHFKHVRISALALLKMVMHARSGKSMEVMGAMQGKIDGDTIIVMDSFALPVEGCETRVNASEQAYAWMVGYSSTLEKVGRLENQIGWYHSHPGYGCWLSGVDVATQRLQQAGQDPYLAIVVDPTQTCAAGKVEIGAFRCYPDGYKPPNAAPSEYQTIPSDKIEDFGVHNDAYYKLDITIFKSSLDRRLLNLLWNKYWVNTLSSSALLANSTFITGQLTDLSRKLKDAGTSGSGAFRGAGGSKKADAPLTNCARDGVKTTVQMLTDVASQVIKDELFHRAVTPRE